MRSRVLVAACGLCVSLAAGVLRVDAQELEETDPCDGSAAPHAECWTREAERADAEMKDALEALAAKLPSRAASELRRSQKLWLAYREAHLAFLYAASNPGRVHRKDDLVCAAIARRQLALSRTRELRRLLKPAGDEACLL